MSDNPYYPVTTSSDTAQLADDEWGLSMPGVQYVRKASKNKRARAIVDGCQSIPRCAVIIVVSLMVLVLVCVIIAVAASREDRNPLPGTMRKQTAMGLNFYPIPEDKTVLIMFKTHKFKNDEAIKKSMDEVMKPYEHSHQLEEEHYVSCNETYAPKNMTCKFPMANFGHDCTRVRDYGYAVNMPCILLQLDLPTNKTIKRITESSKLWEQAKDVPAVLDTESDMSIIPVTCQATSHLDQLIFDKGDPVPSNGERLRYFPGNYIPSYFYRQQDPKADFLKPAVMVQLTSLIDLRLLHLTCTVWGQVFNADHTMEDHQLLSTTFAVYIDE